MCCRPVACLSCSLLLSGLNKRSRVKKNLLYFFGFSVAQKIFRSVNRQDENIFSFQTQNFLDGVKLVRLGELNQGGSKRSTSERGENWVIVVIAG